MNVLVSIFGPMESRLQSTNENSDWADKI